MQNYHVIRSNGKQEGPFSELELKQFYVNKTLPVQTLVWMEGWEEWRPCGEVFAWFPPPAPQGSAPQGINLNARNYVVAGIFAIAFGSLGIHKFYNGSLGWGLVYIILALPLLVITAGLWYCIPIIEGILYLTNEAKYNKKYNDIPAACFKW